MAIRLRISFLREPEINSRLPQSPPHSARIPVHTARPSARGSKGLCHKRIP